ncbi:Amidase [Mesorhizobium loti]|nr:Amidase [Mesorhizobium loti]
MSSPCLIGAQSEIVTGAGLADTGEPADTKLQGSWEGERKVRDGSTDDLQARLDAWYQVRGRFFASLLLAFADFVVEKREASKNAGGAK